MTTTYQRVTYRPEDDERSHTVYLKNPQRINLDGKHSCTYGTVVDKHGSEVKPKGGKADLQQHLIDDRLISKRAVMIMSLLYGHLETVTEGQRQNAEAERIWQNTHATPAFIAPDVD